MKAVAYSKFALKKSKFMPIVIAASALTMSLSAFAGKESSGGGSAVVCFRDRNIAEQVIAQKGMVTNDQLVAIDSIDMLDLFEWKRPRGIDGEKNLALVEPKPGENYRALLHRIVMRTYDTIATHSSSHGTGIGNYMWSMETVLGNIDKSQVIWTGTSLVHLQDEDTPLRFGGNCTLVPMAVQMGNIFDGFRLFIDDRLFFHNKHSEQSRTALFVHEFVYAMARSLGQTNSSATRQAVGYLMVNDSKARILDIQGRLNSLGFETKVKGLRKLGSYSGLNLISRLAYVTAVGKDLKSFWINTHQKWTPNGRVEQEVVNEAKAILDSNGISVPEQGVFVANKAMAYLQLVPESEAKQRLEKELKEIVTARSQKARKFIRHAHGGEAGLKEVLDHFSYLSENDKQFLAKLISETVTNRVGSLAEKILTKDQIDVLRKDEKKAKFPMYSFEELYEDKSSDGEFMDWFYWYNEIIIDSINENHRDFSLYDMRMPLL